MKKQLFIMCAVLALAMGCDQRGRPGSEYGTERGSATNISPPSTSTDTNRAATNRTDTNRTDSSSQQKSTSPQEDQTKPQ